MRVWRWSILSALIFLVGCGASNSMQNGSNNGGVGSIGGGDAMVIVQGNWQINTTSQSGVTGGAGGMFQQNFQNGSLTGSLGNIQPDCATTAALSGTVNLNNVKFSLDENGQVVLFTGAVSSDGLSMNGTFTAPAGGCTNGPSGSWTALRIPPVSGNWSGTLTPASSSQLPFQVAVPLNEDSNGNVTGTAAITGSSCFNTLALSTPSPIAGEKLILGGQAGNGVSVQFTAQLNAAATSMNISYAVSGGACDGQTGAGILANQ